MPGTRRTPIARRTAVRITPRAAEIFVREMEPRRKRCTCERATKERWTGLRQCEPCREWWIWHNKLADEFPGLVPWHWPLTVSPQGHSSEPGAGNELQENLAAELRAAAKEMRKPEPEREPEPAE
jgi:hypothetical protein